MNERDHVKRMLSLTMGIGLAMGAPYNDFDMKIPQCKSKRGHLVGCHICGKTWVTLYKDGDRMICDECRAKG